MASRKRRTRPPEYADPDDVREWAHGLSQSYLLCRELGHNWRPHTARWVTEDQCFERSLRCTRCKTERRQVLSSRGAVASSHYVYPDGYQTHQMGRIAGDSRDALRLESINRTLESKGN